MELPSIMSHVSIGVTDIDRAAAFYDAVLATVGATRQHEVPGAAIAYGKMFPEFWVGLPLNGEPASAGNGNHFSFIAPTKEAVHAFYDAALAAGAVSTVSRALDPNTARRTTGASSSITTDTRSKRRSYPASAPRDSSSETGSQ